MAFMPKGGREWCASIPSREHALSQSKGPVGTAQFPRAHKARVHCLARSKQQCHQKIPTQLPSSCGCTSPKACAHAALIKGNQTPEHTRLAHTLEITPGFSIEPNAHSTSRCCRAPFLPTSMSSSLPTFCTPPKLAPFLGLLPPQMGSQPMFS